MIWYEFKYYLNLVLCSRVTLPAEIYCKNDSFTLKWQIKMKWRQSELIHSYANLLQICRNHQLLKLRVSSWLWDSYAVHNDDRQNVMKKSLCITILHRLCMPMYFYIVDNGNAWINNITEHKKIIHMIYHQSNSIFFLFLLCSPNYVDDDSLYTQCRITPWWESVTIMHIDFNREIL